MADRVVPLTPEFWPMLARLFGKHGACMGCWCMHWRMPHADWQAARGDKAKRLLEHRVREGPPPGVLALADEAAALGWLQIGPRLDTPQWNASKRVSAPLTSAVVVDERVWAATCFFVRPGHRRRGIADQLLIGGIEFAQEGGARVIEACPMEVDRRTSASGLYVGPASVFRRAGFKEVARRKENRPLMRLVVKGSRKRISG